MLHPLTPQFILEQHRLGNRAGNLQAACLFVDLSGFTPLTLALMAHGTEGAEVLADVLDSVFEPLIGCVHAEGGFIAGFAGDAFKALFPVQPGDEHGQSACARALLAAWRIRGHLTANPTRSTRFGDFAFSGKVCASFGPVEWQIWQDPASLPRGQRAASLFTGDGLHRCMAIDPHANTGEIVVDRKLCADLPEGTLAAAPVSGYLRVEGVDLETLAGQRVGSTAQGEGADDRYDLDTASAFFPQWLLTSTQRGEFRHVVTLFVNFERPFDAAECSRFQPLLFQLLDQYDGFLGRVGQIGDKDNGNTLLLFWGAPTGSEQDVARALGFLLDLQAGTPVALRAGMTTELAYAGFVGSSLSEEYTCYGTHVNQAARQMVAAPWSEIWLDGETARQAKGPFHLTPLEARLFKGFSNPRPLFRLEGRQVDTAHDFYSGEFVGRRAELDALLDAIQPIFEERYAGLLLVEGEAGMGKSRLVHEFEQRTLALSPAPQWFLCQADEILRRPLNPLRYWLRHYFEQAPSATERERRSHFDVVLARLCASTPDRGLSAELQRSRSFLAALVDLYWEDSLYAQVDPQLRFENSLEALKTLIKAASLVRPVILGLEDAHLLDEESRAFLELLTHNVEAFPFAIVATRRPQQEPDRFVAAGTPQVEVRLDGFGTDQIQAMVADLLTGGPAPGLLAVIQTRASGNPFFVEQIVLYLRDQELLIAGPDGWQLALSEDAESELLPTDVRVLLTARLDSLPPPVKEVVQTASVLGREFDRRVLEAMVEPQTPLEDHMSQAERVQIWSAVAETRYLFRHALLCDAAYEMQLRARLRRLHRDAAEAVRVVFANEPAPHYAELAHHYRRGEVVDEERTFARLAADHAAETYANEEALRFYSRALVLTPAHETASQIGLLLSREAVLDVSGDRDQQLLDLESMADLAVVAPEDDQLAILLRRAEYQRNRADYATALETVARALQLAVDTDRVEDQIRCLHRQGRILWTSGRYAEARVLLQKAKARAGELELHPYLTRCNYDIGVTYQQEGRNELARPFLLAAQSGFDAEGDRLGLARCTAMIGVIDNELGNYPSAEAQYLQALETCESVGWRFGAAVCLGYLCNNSFALGDYVAASEYNRRALALSRDLADQNGVANALDTHGLLDYMTGQPDAARQRCQEALSLYQAIDDRRGQAYTLTHLGLIGSGLADGTPPGGSHEFSLDEALSGHLPEVAAESHLRLAVAIRTEAGETASRIDSSAIVAWILFQRGDRAEAVATALAIREHLDSEGIGGIEFPFLVFAICAEILLQVSDTSDTSGPQLKDARSLVERGRRELYRRAQAIVDDAQRSRFLEAGPFHLHLLSLARRLGLHSE